MVYVGMEPLPYLAVMQAAREAGLPVSGHVPFKVPRELFFRAGQRSKENLIGEVNTETGGLYVPTQSLDADVQATAASGIWTIPTLTIHKARARQDPATVLLEQPDMRFVPPRQRAHWRGAEGRGFAVRGYKYTGAPELVRRLHQAGARLLLGSDAGYPFVVHGFSIHDELANLVEVGLSPFETLRAGTRDAAEYLGELEHAGTVAEGKRADLLLLPANPLDDVRNVSRRVGVTDCDAACHVSPATTPRRGPARARLRRSAGTPRGV